MKKRLVATESYMLVRAVDHGEYRGFSRDSRMRRSCASRLPMRWRTFALSPDVIGGRHIGSKGPTLSRLATYGRSSPRTEGGKPGENEKGLTSTNTCLFYGCSVW